jgi:hypothetical protein
VLPEVGFDELPVRRKKVETPCPTFATARASSARKLRMLKIGGIQKSERRNDVKKGQTRTDMWEHMTEVINKDSGELTASRAVFGRR